MRQTARIDRATGMDEVAESGSESGAGARRAIALGLLGAGALVGMAAPAASAAVMSAPEPSAVEAAVPAASSAVTHAHSADWSRLGQVKLYPLAGTSVDPLSNVIGTNLSGLPVSTAPVNSVFTDGLPLRDLPVVGTVLSSSAAAAKAPIVSTDAADAGSPADTGTGTGTDAVTNVAAAAAPAADAGSVAAPSAFAAAQAGTASAAAAATGSNPAAAAFAAAPANAAAPNAS